MKDRPLPDDLQQLESDLASRHMPTASPELARRILDGLRYRSSTKPERLAWQFWSTVAAMALVWMNLSLTISTSPDLAWCRHAPGKSIEAFTHGTPRAESDRSLAEFERWIALRQQWLMEAAHSNPI